MISLLVFTIAVPFILSIFALLTKKNAAVIALAAGLIDLAIAINVFFSKEFGLSLFSLHSYTLSAGTFLAASFLTTMVILYSIKFMEKHERLNEYYCYILLTLGATAGALFSNDFLTLMLFWGMLGATLYLLIGMGGPGSAAAAKKSFIIVGGADALMILGIGIILIFTRNLQIGIMQIQFIGPIPYIAYFCLAIGALAKSGAVPLHTWIPDSAEKAPVPVMAFLPASLDKLLGIYLLARLSLDVFEITPGSTISTLLLLLGSITIIVAVMAALVQHNLKKLLSFHAVSQVGYMLLGIGTALPIGIAGGLLHMLNNAIYKCCLFLSAGAVEKKAKTTELDKLGGLGRLMPITFISALIASLSISGMPPFNGFVSKWLIYQSLVELGSSSSLWVIWLAAAMFGSALTLASFIKVIHAVFLGQWTSDRHNVSEVSWQMWLPMAILASLCLLFGIFAMQTTLGLFIIPSVPLFLFSGFFDPVLAALLLITGLVIGALIYLASGRKLVSKPAYIGGESIPEDDLKVPATDFYNTIRQWNFLGRTYRLAENNAMDLYSMCRRSAYRLSDAASLMHNGLLHTYIAWMFLGAILILMVLVF